MSSNVVFNGTTYSIPADGDFNWGPQLTAYFIDIATGTFQRSGGTFTLTAEADFGATYGLRAPYFKSRAANPSGVGAVRLGNTEGVYWRNAANNADLGLVVNASDALLYNSKTVLFSGLGLIVNADVSASAAIAYSKLAALTASRLLVSDVSGFVSVSAVTDVEAAYLSGVTSAIQTQINTKAPSASPTFTGTITTPLTASRLVVTGASNELAASTASSTEATYLVGVTSAIQTQLDAKVLKSIFTTKGDLLVATASATPVRQAVGSDDQTLVADSSQTNGIAYNTVLDKNLIQNLGITTSVGSNALTIALKTAAGNNASSTDPVKVGFRNATLTNGQASLVKSTAALSLVISSGSTLGHSSGSEHPIYVYLINNAGTMELAASTILFDESVLVSTTAEGGAGAADSNNVMYSTTARSNVTFRVVAKLLSTQTTAGTWAAVPTNTILGTFASFEASDFVGCNYSTSTALAVVTGGTQIVWPTKEEDPQNSMNTSTGAYTCPTPGLYEVFSQVYPNTTASTAYSILFNGTARVTNTGPNASGALCNAAAKRYRIATAGQTITTSLAGLTGNLVGAATGNSISIRRVSR